MKIKGIDLAEREHPVWGEPKINWAGSADGSVVTHSKHGINMPKCCYISGAMRGIRWYNFGAFDVMANRLRANSYRVVNPADLDRKEGFDPRELPDNHDWDTLPDGMKLRETAKRDLIPLLEECTHYVVLPGPIGAGTKAEIAVAEWIGLQRLHPETLEPWSETVLEEAQRITSGDRNGSYGHPAEHWKRTTGMINALFGTDFKPEDWGKMMILDKIARDFHNPLRDNIVDVSGYARCIERVRERTDAA